MKDPAEDRLNSLEADLERSLRRVQPDPVFVDRLRTNLSTPAAMVVEKRNSPVTSLAALIFGMGLAVGLLLIWIVRQFR